MNRTSFFHVCADGADAKNFIVCGRDFKAAFNMVGTCAAVIPEVKVVAFSIEDTHPHFLLSGTRPDCVRFKDAYVLLYKRYLWASRGTSDSVVLDFQIIEIEEEEHLMKVGTYIVNQATKDGKKVMPFDYRWSSGPLYFRSADVIPVWCARDGNILPKTRMIDMPADMRRRICHTKAEIPGEWLVCDGLLLPQNYVDVASFEKIYKTHNCYRTFLSSGRSKDESVVLAIADARGVTVEDIEIRKPCGDLAKNLFGVRDARRLNADQRLRLALELRKRYRLSRRQIATLVRLPLSEVERYVR